MNKFLVIVALSFSVGMVAEARALKQIAAAQVSVATDKKPKDKCVAPIAPADFVECEKRYFQSEKV